MTAMRTLPGAQLGTRASGSQGPYECLAFGSFETARPRWDALYAMSCATVFQSPVWLESWYAEKTSADTKPLVIFVQDRRTGRDVMALALVHQRAKRRAVVTFADAGVTDYNAPLLPPDAPSDDTTAVQMWKAIRKVLPACDLVLLEKMPRVIEGRINPLSLLPNAKESSQCGNVLDVPGAWDDYHWGLEKTFRKELERSWRVFEKHDGAEFRIAEGPDEAVRLHGELARLQEARIAELGLPYILGEQGNAAFFERLVREGAAGGDVVLTALVAEETVVAALLGITRGTQYAMVRLGQASGPWKNCSPGRLVIERTMHALHASGFRSFDFTTGDYAYKRRMGVLPVALAELREAGSLLGVIDVWSAAARRRLRQSETARSLAARLRPKSAARH